MKKKFNYVIFVKIFLLILIGIIAIIIPTNQINYFHLSLYLGMGLYGIFQIFESIKGNKFSYFNLIFVSINIFMTLLISFFPYIYIKLLPIILGLYIFIIGIARLMTTFIYDKIPESKINIFINSIIHFTFSFILIFGKEDNLKLLTFIIGIYLILLGISYIPKGSHNKNNIKIVQIPTIFQSLKPYNDFIKIDFEHYNNQDRNLKVDIEVLIHVKKHRRGVFGHADLIYNNKVYSYGNYDISTYKLSDAIGEGVLLEMNKEQYINYCKQNGKTLFSFGIKLNEEEKKKTKERFDKIMNKTYEFKKENIVKGSFIDTLSQNVDINFYKFKEGYYKNYFFLNYNCVKFIEEVISPKLVNFTSIKTPGTLYTRLEDMYMQENSKVVSKIIY